MSFKAVLDTITEKTEDKQFEELKLKIKAASKKLNTLQDEYKKLTGKTYQW